MVLLAVVGFLLGGPAGGCGKTGILYERDNNVYSTTMELI